MHDVFPERIGPQDLLTHQRVTDRYVSYNAYNHFIDAPRFDIDPAVGPPVRGRLGGGPYIDMAKGVSGSVIRATFERHQEWTNGILGFYLHYTGNAAGGAFDINGRINLYKEGDDLGTFGTSTVLQQFPAGPAIINGKVALLYELKRAVDARYSWVTVVVVCNGASASYTNTGDFRFLGVRLIYTETTRQT